MTTRQHITPILLLLLFLSPYSMAAGAGEYEQGLQALEQQDYVRAQTLMEQSETAGNSGPGLDFHLGLAHFHLGNYDEARQRLDKVPPASRWSEQAIYHLGLVAQKQGDIKSARLYFFQALASPQSRELRVLAADRFDEMDTVDSISRQPLTFVSAAFGHDDNATLTADSDAETASNQSDNYIEVFGNIGAVYSGNYLSGYRWNVGAYVKAWSDIDDFDFSTLTANITRHRPLGDWEVQFVAKADVSYSGGDYFASDATLRLRADREFGNWELRLRDDITWRFAASDFEHLDGLRNRTRAELRHRQEQNEWRLYYQFEINDRDDQQSGEEFFSHSPTRHTVSADYIRDFAQHWETQFRYSYRDSRYDDVNRELVNGSLQSIRREEERNKASARLSYLRPDKPGYFIEYQYLDNDSSLARNSYESNQVSVGVDLLF